MHIPASLEGEEHGSHPPPRLPRRTVMPTDGEGQFVISWLGSSLCRREAVPTGEVSSSCKISAFRCSLVLATVPQKRLQSAAAHSLNFYHEKQMMLPACAAAPCSSSLSAWWWHLYPCFSPCASRRCHQSAQLEMLWALQLGGKVIQLCTPVQWQGSILGFEQGLWWPLQLEALGSRRGCEWGVCIWLNLGRLFFGFETSGGKKKKSVFFFIFSA